MTRIYVPLDKDMTDAEVLAAMKAAAEEADKLKVREEAERTEESPADEGSDG